jgi:hypothetical protein
MLSNYACLAPGAAPTATYRPVVQPIIPNSITVFARTPRIAPGALDTFIAVAPYGGSSPAYQWRINSAPVPGATTSMFITSTLTDHQVVSCEVTSSNPCVFPHTELSSGDTVYVWAAGVRSVANGQNNFSLVPNPNKGAFTISGTVNSNENISIVVTDVLGQTICTRSINAHNGIVHEMITLGSNIANGMYLVSITSGSDHVVFHMAINK